MKAKASSSGAVAVSASQRVHNTGVYIARHWQLYLIFILPAVVLTLTSRTITPSGASWAASGSASSTSSASCPRRTSSGTWSTP